MASWIALAIVVIPVFPHFISPNEVSRWAVTASIVERGTVEVTWLLPLLGPRLEDLSEIDGRVYSNKAPGVSLLSIPGYLAARVVAGPPSSENLRWSLYGCRLVTATVPVALLSLLLTTTGFRVGGSRERVRLLLLVLLFGTPLHIYGLLHFSHALVAGALFGAWVLLWAPQSQSVGRDLAAGAAIGVAVLSEYPAVVPALVLVAPLVLQRRLDRIAAVVAGGLPFAVALGIYQQLAFGSMFTVSSGLERHAEFRELAASGVFGVGLPSPLILFRLLLDPSKGLLLFTPLLLLFPWWLRSARSSLSTTAFVTLLGVPLSLLLLYAGYPNWHGGWTVGVRYLIPALPFLLFPMVFASRARGEWPLAGWGIAAVVITAAAFPFVPENFPLPWASFAAPFLTRGLIAPSLLHFATWWLAVVFPFVVVIAAIAMAVRGRVLPAIALGILLAIGSGHLVDLLFPSPLRTLQRAYIEQVYFEQPGAIERDLPGVPIPSSLERREQIERRLPPPSWPRN